MGKSENLLHDVLKNFDVAILVTHHAKQMHARPMVVARLDADMDIYLLTDSDLVKVHEINQNPDALITFQSSKQFASVKGEVVLSHDRVLLESMWKETWKVWFPKGIVDPNVAILKFTAHEGEFWDNAGMQGLKYLYGAAKAYIAGERPTLDSSQHNIIKL
jgi:general stress protein 26